VLLWYIGMSVWFVANVFRSVGVDYRLVALGALLPLIVDLPAGHRWFGHTLVFAAAALLIVMVGTIGRTRLLRRRLICVPIGIFVGLVLSGAWTGGDAFWWPVLGGGLGHHSLLPATWAVIVEEVVGLVACWWVVGQFDLYLPEVRREFWRTGRLRAVV